MNKAQMIDAIIGMAKSTNARNVSNKKQVDFGDMFFALAFRTNKELKAICKKLRIKK